MGRGQPTPLYQRIYTLVSEIPPGRVCSYGQIARLLGCSPRNVGFAMAALPPGSSVPWQRVINSQGKVSPRRDSEGDHLQRDLLEAEGVVFDRSGRIDLERYTHGFAALD